MITDLTECSVVAIDARFLDTVGLLEAVVLTTDERAAIYLADPGDHLTLARSLGDESIRLLIPTDELISGLDVTPLQEGQ